MRQLMYGAVLSYPNKFMRTISALSALTKCILAIAKGAAAESPRCSGLRRIAWRND